MREGTGRREGGREGGREGVGMEHTVIWMASISTISSKKNGFMNHVASYATFKGVNTHLMSTTHAWPHSLLPSYCLTKYLK